MRSSSSPPKPEETAIFPKFCMQNSHSDQEEGQNGSTSFKITLHAEISGLFRLSTSSYAPNNGRVGGRGRIPWLGSPPKS